MISKHGKVLDIENKTKQNRTEQNKTKTKSFRSFRSAFDML